MPLEVSPLVLFVLFNVKVTGVTQDHLFVAIPQIMRMSDVMDIGCRADHDIYQTCHVHTNMGFHPKAPLVALFGLMHLWTEAASGVLGRAGRLYDHGIHNSARAHRHASILQEQIRGLRRLDGDAVLLQRMPKAQNYRLVRNAATGTAKTQLLRASQAKSK